MNPQESIARKVKTTLSPVSLFDGEEMWRISWPVDTMGVPTESHATPVKRRDEKRDRTKNRCQVPARGQNRNDDKSLKPLCIKQSTAEIKNAVTRRCTSYRSV